MTTASQNYSITEVELCGLAINIASFSPLLKRVDFDAVVEFLTQTHIMKSNWEPATNRNKKAIKHFDFIYIQSLLFKWQRYDS